MRSGILTAAAVVVAISAACRKEPPRVELSLPAEVEAGSAADVEAVVSPGEDGLAYYWKVEWLRDRPGAPPCDPSWEGAPGAKRRLVFPKDCDESDFLVRLDVSSRAGIVKAKAKIHVVPQKEPLWPARLPASWKLLDDYESKGDVRRNLWGGYFGTWGFNSGRCALRYGPEVGGVLELSYSLPMDDSSCGTFEYLAGDKGKSRPVDISSFGKIVFLLKSGDGSVHHVRFEVVEYDPYAQGFQGYVGSSAPLEAGKEWRRYEVVLDDVLHPRFDRTKGKQVGLRIERKEQEQASGKVLLDNVAFVAVAREKGGT